jgi:hypothetical protein
MSRRLVQLVVINVVIFVVLAEGLGLFLYYVDTGHLFYTHTAAPAAIEETARGALTGDVLHPYFGPIHRPGIRAETNNIGFGSPHQFPFARTDARQFLVGVFGGSVARQFCDRGQQRLFARFAGAADLAGREPVLLCFAHEGYKQPQQLLILSYFLSLGQELDLAINIDGFNEVALGSYNADRGRDISMPSPIHLDPLINLVDQATMTPARIESLADISRYKRRLNELAEKLRVNRLAAVDFLLRRYHARTRTQYEAELARFETLPSNPPTASLIQVTPAVKARDERSLYPDIAAGWTQASLLMNDLLTSRGVPYVHVLQPNQYYTARTFGEDEARVARNETTGFKPPVEKGYPVLEQAAARLNGKERFVNATTIFDSEPAAVYADDCCHYTDRGYEILADTIATTALEAVAPARSSVR